MDSQVVSWISQTASIITSLTVIGGAGLWGWNKFVTKPREKREEERNQKLIKTFQDSTKPHIELLTQNTNQIEKLTEIVERYDDLITTHESRLDNHNDRLIVLETKNGIKRISYKEKYQGVSEQ